MAAGVDDWTAAMRSGAYERAWDMALASLVARDPATRDDPALPYHLRWVWSGEPVDGRDVLVRCYHGLGDTLQFARFLPLLAARAAIKRAINEELESDLVEEKSYADTAPAISLAAG